MERLVERVLLGEASESERAQVEQLRTSSDSVKLANRLWESGGGSTLTQFFALQILERQLSSSNAVSLQRYLLAELANSNRMKDRASYVVAKVVKLCVDVCRLAPDTQQGYVRVALKFCDSADYGTRSIGLELVKCFAEECGVDRRGDLDSARAASMCQAAVRVAPQLVGALEAVLGACVVDLPRHGGVARQVLDALTAFFAWLPTEMMRVQLIDLLFRVVGERRHDNCLRAFACVNELLERNRVPASALPLYVKIFRHVFALLQSLMREQLQSSSSSSEVPSTAYLASFTHFASLFVEKHLARLEASSFPVRDFLRLLFDFTFAQRSLDGFVACADIWETFVEHLANNVALAKHYASGIAALLRRLIQSMLFAGPNGRHLCSLARASPSSSSSSSNLTLLSIDVGSDLFEYLTTCHRLVGLISSVYPSDTLHLLRPLLQQKMRALAELFARKSDEAPPPGDRAAVALLARDAVTVLEMHSNLAHRLVDPALFARHLDHTMALLKAAIGALAAFDVRLRAAVGAPAVDAHCALLALLRAHVPWLAKLANEGRQAHERIVLAIVGNVCVPRIVDATLAVGVRVGAASLLSRVARHLRPPNFVKLPAVASLAKRLHAASARGGAEFPLAIVSPCYVALSAACVLPRRAGATSGAEWEARRAYYVRWMHAKFAALESPAPALVEHHVRVATAVVSLARTAPKPGKQIVALAIEPLLSVAHQALRAYASRSPALVTVLLEFFAALFDNLSAQIGVAAVRATADLLVKLMPGAALVRALGSGDQRSVSAVKRLLKLLALSVRSGGRQFESLVPTVVALALDDVLPAVSSPQSAHVDVRRATFALLQCCVVEHWRLFVGAEQRRFAAILAAFRASFACADIGTFRSNMALLGALDDKRRLFSRRFFVDNMRLVFLAALMDALVADTHRLLRDDIVALIYRLAAVDFGSFYAQFVRRYIARSIEELASNENAYLGYTPGNTDEPSFRKQTLDFVVHFRSHKR
jgi:hypothetical protein